MKYLFWFGPFLISAGLAVGLVSETWNTIPLVLIGSGTAVIIGWLIWQIQENKWWERRSTQAGTNAIIATLAMVTILALVNFLGLRYHYRIDVTESRLFSLAPQTQQLLSSLKEPIKVLIFDSNQNPQDQDLLENYRRQSSNFDFEYINPWTKPVQVKTFGVQDEGEVYLTYKQQRKLVQVINQNQRLSEIRLTNTLQQVTSNIAPKVYFLQGHGEPQIVPSKRSISQAFQAVKDTIFLPEPLNLVELGSVPEDANAVVVAGPQKELFAKEVEALQKYLEDGGNLFLMIDPDTDPKLNSLLTQWGVKLDDRLVVDVSGSVEHGPVVILVREYAKHPITKDFGNGYSLYPFARPITVTPVDNIQATELIKTKPYPNSWAESDLKNEDLQFDEGSDRKGPLTLGVALRKTLATSSQVKSNPIPTPTPTPKATATNSPTPSPTPTASPTPKSETKEDTEKSEEKPKESRLVIIGDSDFATNGLFDKQLNGDVFLNSVTWLSQLDDIQTLSIRPKEPKNRRLNLEPTQSLILSSTSIIILPLLGFATAGFLWWFRRR